MREYFVKKHVVRVSSLLLVVLMVFSFSSCSKVEVAEGEIIAVFQYGDAEISKPLSDEDSEIVRKIFDGKRLFSDSPSCGFDENVALIIDGNTYCIACDTCGVIYNVEKDKYFNLNDKENETLRNLLCEYGFTFPCV
jgi:hypothetical protein